jgi:hypothetical protein
MRQFPGLDFPPRGGIIRMGIAADVFGRRQDRAQVQPRQYSLGAALTGLPDTFQ